MEMKPGNHHWHPVCSSNWKLSTAIEQWYEAISYPLLVEVICTVLVEVHVVFFNVWYYDADCQRPASISTAIDGKWRRMQLVFSWMHTSICTLGCWIWFASWSCVHLRIHGYPRKWSSLKMPTSKCSHLAQYATCANIFFFLTHIDVLRSQNQETVVYSIGATLCWHRGVHLSLSPSHQMMLVRLSNLVGNKIPVYQW